MLSTTEAKVTEAEVLAVIQSALGAQGREITFASQMGSIEAWDSLGHLGILAALDRKFDGKIAGIQEIAPADSVSKILDVLRAHALI